MHKQRAIRPSGGDGMASGNIFFAFVATVSMLSATLAGSFSACWRSNSDLSNFDRTWDRKATTEIDRPSVRGKLRSGSRPAAY